MASFGSGVDQENLIAKRDDQSTIHLMKNSVHHERSKNIDIRLHHSRSNYKMYFQS